MDVRSEQRSGRDLVFTTTSVDFTPEIKKLAYYQTVWQYFICQKRKNANFVFDDYKPNQIIIIRL